MMSTACLKTSQSQQLINYYLFFISILFLFPITITAQTISSEFTTPMVYQTERWHPLHFYPAITQATDQQCLNCHSDILTGKIRKQSPAGLNAEDTGAWYQNLNTYTGEQETFHRRHLSTPLARKLMHLRCNFCHQGHDPREAAPSSVKLAASGFNLRKSVNTETICLRCHGQESYLLMGLPAPWPESHDQYDNNCLTCHDKIRTQRHQVKYLNAEAIEQAGSKNADVCYGCHGGRAWYQLAYPYPRTPWPGMPEQVPDWAVGRTTSSNSLPDLSDD